METTLKSYQSLPGKRPLRRRLVEIGVGLGFIVLAIVLTRVWVEVKNVRRADSAALRQSVELTLGAAHDYGLDGSGESRRAWAELLNRPTGQRLPTRAAHEFVNTFVLCFQDGVLDSAETVALYRRLMAISPSIE